MIQKSAVAGTIRTSQGTIATTATAASIKKLPRDSIDARNERAIRSANVGATGGR